MSSFQQRIEQKKNSITASEQKIINQLNQHDKPFLLSMNELSLLSQVSEPSVVRLYRKLGYASYQELKVALAQELAESKSTSTDSHDIQIGDQADVVFEKISDQISSALSMTKDTLNVTTIEQAVFALQKAKRLYFFGQGLSGTIAEDGAHKFMRLGETILSVKDPHYQAIYASHMNEQDVVIAISHSGETVDIIDVIDIAKSNGAQVIVITSNRNTTLASMANYLLLTQAAETNQRSDAMVSRIVQLALIDTLYTRIVSLGGDQLISKVNQSRLAVTRMKK
ncbi:MurR/RpiR family transcriptional regulator [Alkalicoccobacillus murimartini]|uniref:DNA-binding MurR/RpiR family transcriptional regulator n=1 Tax=Alkalicoccobacillus murimartini TaxID=171685 RepID=A0ABT9YGD2_9BACI|nr:MurR/RpiR family transcriptional regulator [Alkalicoccobacillus murimartini]MDQ0206885.1 DNA-binding MurR/RpiR family transcriptional regulator [Alkalicoccobacillus murimartini]